MTDNFNKEPNREPLQPSEANDFDGEVDSHSQDNAKDRPEQSFEDAKTPELDSTVDYVSTDPDTSDTSPSDSDSSQSEHIGSGSLPESQHLENTMQDRSRMPEPPQPRTPIGSYRPPISNGGSNSGQNISQDNGIENLPGSNPYHEDHVHVTIGKSSFNASAADAEEIRRAQRLTFIASTCGIFSLFFGGIVLGTIGLIVAIVAYRRLGRIGERYPHDPRIAQTLKHNGRLAITVCSIALSLNVISLIILFPALMQAAEMGDYSQLLNGFDAGQGTGSGSGVGTESGNSGSTSAWG